MSFSVRDAAIAPIDAHRNTSDGSLAVSASIALATGPSLRAGFTASTFSFMFSNTSVGITISFLVVDSFRSILSSSDSQTHPYIPYYHQSRAFSAHDNYYAPPRTLLWCIKGEHIVECLLEGSIRSIADHDDTRALAVLKSQRRKPPDAV